MSKKFIFSKLGVDAQVDAKLLDTVQEALGKNRTLEWIQRRTDSDYRDTHFAAYEINGEVACVNFFTPFSFRRGAETVNGCQSGFSATKNVYKGRGLWVGLMREAEKHLAENSLNFIFGFPNSVSLPIFLNKLGYQVKNLQPNLFLRNTILQKFLIDESFAWEGRGHQVVGDINDFLPWHKRQSDVKIKEYTHDSSLIWGKRKVFRICKMHIQVIEIGGVEGCDFTNIYEFIQKILIEEDLSIAILYASANLSKSRLDSYLKRKSVPVIFKRLNEGWETIDDVIFTGGMRDTF